MKGAEHMTKRLLALCLSLVLLLGLLPAGVSAAVITSDVNTGYNTATATASQSGLFSTAYVRNTVNGANRTPQSIEAVVNLRDGGEAGQLVYAVVMLAANFDAQYAAQLTNINNTSYAGLPVSANYYAIGAHSKGTGTTLTLPLVIANPANAGVLQADGTLPNKVMPKSPVGGKYYQEEYVLVVFAFDSPGFAERYYVDRFYMDAEGYVLTPSYGVRYNENNPTGAYGTGTVGNMPTNGNSSNNRTFYQRAAWSDANLTGGTPGAMTLSNVTPTRTGYEFVGWTDQPLDPLAAGVEAPANGASITSGSKSATFYTGGGTYGEPNPLNRIYDLYALWRTVPVKFSHTSTANYTVTQEDGAWVMTWKGKLPQVNVSFASGGLLYEKPGTTGEPVGNKTFQIVTKEDGTVKGTTVTNAYNQNNANHYGLIVKQVNTRSWGITGTPSQHSDGKVVTLELKVTDTSNNTSDTITVKFSEVKRGAQPIPTADVNTGLQSQVATLTDEQLAQLTDEQKSALAEGNKDGQIYGFYSAGPTKDSAAEYTENDTGYRDTVDGTATGLGTGTMTNYYLSKGMAFEYRPIRVGSETISWADKTEGGATTDGYADMPNDGWREVPFPSGRYTATDLATIQASNGLNAKTVTYGTLANSNAATRAVVTNQTTSASEKFKAEGWLNSYGWIEFNDAGLPVLHGLKENDVYEIRFRANANFSASEAKEITIGGAVAAGTPSGGSGVDVNLAGGQWKAGEESDGKTFEDTAAALQPGGTLTLPEIEPEREGGYTFAGWTLGERDSDGRLLLYRRGAAVTPPAEPEMVTVTWINGETNENISHTVTSVPKGSTVAKEDYPETPADIDKDAEGENPAVHKTFDKWTVAVDETTGNITITATFKDKPAVTYVWTDPLQEGEDKTVENAGWTNPSYNPPTAEQHPAAPDHGEDHPFKAWLMGEAVEVPVEGSETGETRLQVTVTATYKEKATYVWVDPEIRGEEGQEPPSQVVQTKELFDLTKDDYPATDPSHPGMDFKGWEAGEPVRGEDGTVTVTITATYGKKITYVWVDPKKADEDKTVKGPEVAFEKPEDPEAPVHEGWTFLGWTVGEPVTDEESGVTTVTITATYEMEKWTVLDTLPAIQNFPASLAAVWNGGSGGGGGLAVNLAGGHWTTEDEGAGQSFTADCAALQPGDSITIPDITPVRETYSFLGWTFGEIDPATHLLVTYSAGQSVRLGNEASSLAAVWNSTTEGILAISVTDWDGVSLGTFIFRSDSNPTTQEQNARQALDEFLAREDVAAVLKSHAGYDYLTMVKDEDRIPTSYGERVDSVSMTTRTQLELNKEDAVDFSTLEQSTNVKVAYTTNGEIQVGDGLSVADARDARRYTTSIESYGRFGTGNSFAIRIKVERGNVPRVTEGALRVRLEISGVSVYSQYELSGADVETIEIAPFAQSATNGNFTGVSTVEWTVIDSYGTSNWVGAGGRTTLTECRSKASFKVKSVGGSNSAVWDEGTYPFYGVLAGINDTLTNYHQLKLVDPELTPTSSNMGGITANILRTIDIPPSTSNAAALRTAIYDGWLANGAKDLTYEELYRIASGT